MAAEFGSELVERGRGVRCLACDLQSRARIDDASVDCDGGPDNIVAGARGEIDRNSSEQIASTRRKNERFFPAKARDFPVIENFIPVILSRIVTEMPAAQAFLAEQAPLHGQISRNSL